MSLEKLVKSRDFELCNKIQRKNLKNKVGKTKITILICDSKKRIDIAKL